MTAPLTIVMFHYVRPIAGSRFPAMRGLEVTGFEGQLDYIERHHTVVSAAAVVEAARGGRPLPERPILLTFDDGYSDHHRYAFPALRRRKYGGAFYAPGSAVLERKLLDVNKIQFALASVEDPAAMRRHLEDTVDSARDEFGLAPIEEYRARFWEADRMDTAETVYVKRMLQLALPRSLRSRLADELFRQFVTSDERDFANELYVSEADLREMVEGGMEVGPHGYAHEWLGSLPREEQMADIDRSLTVLDRIGVSRRDFSYCYPFGSYNSDTMDILTERGCSVAFTSEVGLVRLESARMLALPRIDTWDLPQSGIAPPVSWTRETQRALA